MSDPAFDRPHGEPGALRAAAQRLHTVATDLGGQQTAAKSAVSTALEQWRGPRADTFRHAGAGLQVELLTTTTATSALAGILDGYATTLASAQSQVAELKRQADAAQAEALRHIATLPPDSVDFDRSMQVSGRREAQLAEQARTIKTELSTAAAKVAAAIDVQTEMAVPGGSALSPSDLGRRVTARLGVSTIVGPLTPDELWAELTSAADAVPDDAVGAEGEVDFSKAVAEFNDKYLGLPISAFAIGTTPPAGWALYQLAANQRAVTAVQRSLAASFSEIMGPTMQAFDRGEVGWDAVNPALARYRAVADAEAALGPGAQSAEALDAARAGGLSETGLVGGLGKLFAGLGVVSDVMTIKDPGVENRAEGNSLRVTAGVNIAATGAVFGGGAAAGLIGLNAAADWIPVVGEVVMVATGLILAGDYAYHHWDQISHFVADTVPNAVGDAAESVGDGLGSAANAVGDFVAGLF